MSSKENYSLRWSNHQNHILRAFDALLQTKTLVDVTLVCAETSIRAHKVVLSACSPFFQRVFNETPCKHPVIVLKDFHGWIVQAIIDFMYRGEISVPQDKLQQLIQAGESLQVRGLIDHSIVGTTPLSVAESSDEFNALDNSFTSTPIVSPTNYTTSVSNTLLPQVFVDSSIQLNNSDICVSPMPRRKQARPRRRSGDSEPQDLSNGITTKIEQDELMFDAERDDDDIPKVAKNVNHFVSNHHIHQSEDDEDNNNGIIIQSSKRLKQNDNNNNQSQIKLNRSHISMDNGDHEDNDEKENLPNSTDTPENLCTKNKLVNNIEMNDTKFASASESACATENLNNLEERSAVNDKNNNNNTNNSDNKRKIRDELQDRFILSLKDIRHLNRSYRHHPQQQSHHPQHHFNEILSHLPLSPPTPPFHNNVGYNFHHSHQQQQHQENHHQSMRERERERDRDMRERERERERERDRDHNRDHDKLRDHDKERKENNHEKSMKVESDRSDDDSPVIEQMDLSMPSHSAFPSGVNPSAAIAAVAALEREHKQKSKDFLMNSPNLNFPPPFPQPNDPMSGRHGHPSSPLSFPPMPSVSSLALTPPHIFGLDSPLGLFPPGMDPGKMYNPLMELPDPRNLHPDHTQFLKKKLNRPKGQHSAPRGGPPRSWTNAELTEALQHVWNKKMTTSQASRIFGIPYNSLLMYVRGKYGKSLKLEQLRKDCISGPPIELLQMGVSGSNSNSNGGNSNSNKSKEKNHSNEDSGSLSGSNQQHERSMSNNCERGNGQSSSESDLLSSPNPLFNPFPSGLYPEFPLPGLQLSMLSLLPPDRIHNSGLPLNLVDDDCKSDQSKQSLDDDYQPQPLALNREVFQQSGDD